MYLNLTLYISQVERKIKYMYILHISKPDTVQKRVQELVNYKPTRLGKRYCDKMHLVQWCVLQSEDNYNTLPAILFGFGLPLHFFWLCLDYGFTILVLGAILASTSRNYVGM